MTEQPGARCGASIDPGSPYHLWVADDTTCQCGASTQRGDAETARAAGVDHSATATDGAAGEPQGAIADHNARVDAYRAALDRLRPMASRGTFVAMHANDIAALLEMLDSYEDGITWQTTCLNCIKVLNADAAVYFEVSRERDALRAEVARLREELRGIYETRRARIVVLTNRMKPEKRAEYLADVDAKLAALVPPATGENQEETA